MKRRPGPDSVGLNQFAKTRNLAAAEYLAYIRPY